MSEPVHAVVAGHGELAEGLVSAVAQITGRGDRLHPIGNRGLGLDELTGRVRELVDGTGARVVFTDLPAGSVTRAACLVAREREGLVVVAGVNLAVLLDFVFHEDGEPGDVVAQSVSKGREALFVVGAGGGR